MRSIAHRDSLAVHQNSLAKLLVPQARFQLGEDFEPSAYASGYVLRGFAAAILNHLAALANAPHYERGNSLGDVEFNKRLSDRDTVDVIVPARCETGHTGSYMPIVGFPDFNNNPDTYEVPRTPEIRPFDVGEEWFFDVHQESEIRKVQNGFYRDMAVYFNPLLGATHFVVKIPPDELTKMGRTGHYALSAYCRGRKEQFDISVPFHKDVDSQALEGKFQAENSPPYQEMDWDENGDGVTYRRGAFYSGPNSRKDPSIIAEYLKAQGFNCRKTEDVPLIESFLTLVREKGERRLDYLVRDGHTHGYAGSEKSGLFYSYEKGVVYGCVRVEKSPYVKRLIHEVFVYAYEGERDHGVMKMIPMGDFIDAVSASERNTKLLFGNTACNTETHSASVFTPDPDIPLTIIATQRSSQRITNQADPTKDSHLGLFMGIVDSLTYSEMKKKYPRLEVEDVLTPDHPAYAERLLNAANRLAKYNQISVAKVQSPLVGNTLDVLEGRSFLEKDQSHLESTAKSLMETVGTSGEQLTETGKKKLVGFKEKVEDAALQWSTSDPAAIKASLVYRGQDVRWRWLQVALGASPDQLDAATLWKSFQTGGIANQAARQMGDRGVLYLVAVLEGKSDSFERAMVSDKIYWWKKTPGAYSYLMDRIPEETTDSQVLSDIGRLLSQAPPEEVVVDLVDRLRQCKTREEMDSYLIVFRKMDKLEMSVRKEIADIVLPLALDQPEDELANLKTDGVAMLGHILADSGASFPALVDGVRGQPSYRTPRIARALGRIGGDPEEAVAALTHLADSLNEENRIAAFEALGEYSRRGSKTAEKFLLDKFAAVSDAEAIKLGIRVAIARGAPNLGPRILEILDTKTNPKDSSREIAYSEQEIAEKMNPAYTIPFAINLLKKSCRIPMALTILEKHPDLGKEAVPYLTKELEGDALFKTRVLKIFVAMGEKAGAAREAILKNTLPEDHFAALALHSIHSGPVPPDREKALAQVLDWGPKKEIPGPSKEELSRRTADFETSYRHNVLDAVRQPNLSELGEAIVPFLKRELEEASKESRAEALRSLANTKLVGHFLPQLRAEFQQCDPYQLGDLARALNAPDTLLPSSSSSW